MHRGTSQDPTSVWQLPAEVDGFKQLYKHLDMEGLPQFAGSMANLSKSLSNFANIERTVKSFGNIESAIKSFSQVKSTIRPFIDSIESIGRAMARSARYEIQRRRNQLLAALVKLHQKRDASNSSFSQRFHKFLIGELVRLFTRLRQAINTLAPPSVFTQQVLSKSSVMLTGPPVTATGLPVFNSVTTWERVI
jgi:hypothetical protein